MYRNIYPPGNEVAYPTKQETRKKSSTQTFPSFRREKCLFLGENKIRHAMGKRKIIFNDAFLGQGRIRLFCLEGTKKKLQCYLEDHPS